MSATPPASRQVDQANREYWDELCGTGIARELGVTDATPLSLARFDEWFFRHYSYLDRHIPFRALRGKRTLEVGLGFGSVSQRLAESGAQFTGLDIATAPVGMARHRLMQNRLPGNAVCGSILQAPFPDAAFDWVVAIGCYHHTGNLQGALDETHRLLRPGGTAIIMLYSAFSYRRWLGWPGATWRQLAAERFGRGVGGRANVDERRIYDKRLDGTAAPETVFTSVSGLRRMAAGFRHVTVTRENVESDIPLLRFVPRALRLAVFSPFIGLDLYCRLDK